MASPPPSRQQLGAQLLVNALTKPLNVVVPGGVGVTAAVAGLPLLIPVALAAYVGLVIATLRDKDEIDRLSRKLYGDKPQRTAGSSEHLAAEIQRRLDAALEQEAEIERCIAAAELPFEDAAKEVDRLVSDLDETARRAQRIVTYLNSAALAESRRKLVELERRNQRTVSGVLEHTVESLREQIRVADDMDRRLQDFYDRMDYVVVELGTIHARFVQMSVRDERQAQSEIADRIRELRQQVGGVADELQAVADAA